MPHGKMCRAHAPGPDPSYTCTQAPYKGRGQKVAVVTGCGQGSNQPRTQPGEAGRQQRQDHSELTLHTPAPLGCMMPLDSIYKIQTQGQNYEEFQDNNRRALNSKRETLLSTGLCGPPVLATGP